MPTILEVVCRTTGMGFSAVARVTEDRWIACAVRDEIAFGLKPGGELKLETTICNEIRQSGQLVVIDHVAEDARLPRPPRPRDVRLPELHLGADPPSRRRSSSARCARSTAAGARQHAGDDRHVQAVRRPDRLSSRRPGAARRQRGCAAGRERQTAELREQFIAVLGHDLRNPLAVDRRRHHAAANDAARRARQRRSLRSCASSVGRMAGLIDNVLDFARGRLGGGMPVDRKRPTPTSAPTLEQVVTELRDRVAGPRDREPTSSWTRRSLRPRAHRAAVVEPARQRADARRSRDSRCACAARPTAAVRALGRQPAAIADPAATRSSGCSSPSPRGRSVQPQGPRPRPLHRHRDRPRPWRDLEVSSTPEETRFTFRMPL